MYIYLLFICTVKHYIVQSVLYVIYGSTNAVTCTCISLYINVYVYLLFICTVKHYTVQSVLYVIYGSL